MVRKTAKHNQISRTMNFIVMSISVCQQQHGTAVSAKYNVEASRLSCSHHLSMKFRRTSGWIYVCSKTKEMNENYDRRKCHLQFLSFFFFHFHAACAPKHLHILHFASVWSFVECTSIDCVVVAGTFGQFLVIKSKITASDKNGDNVPWRWRCAPRGGLFRLTAVDEVIYAILHLIARASKLHFYFLCTLHPFCIRCAPATK